MSRGIILLKYFKERFSPFPWAIVPFFILIMSLDDLGKINFSIIFNTFVGIIFFRVFDDLGCFYFDKKNHEKRTYFSKNSFKVLLQFSYVISTIYLFHCYLFAQNLSVMIILILIVISMILYRTLKNNKNIQFVSLLKYPVMMIFIESNTKGEISIWPIVVFIVFFITEYIEIYKIITIKVNFYKYVPFFVLIGIKLLMVS